MARDYATYVRLSYEEKVQLELATELLGMNLPQYLRWSAVRMAPKDIAMIREASTEPKQMVAV